MPKSITEVKRACHTCTIHGNNQKAYSYECVFEVTINNCLLVWMCCNRSLNTKVDWMHEQYLWIDCNDKKSNFNKVLEKVGSLSIHHQNLQKLANEMIKVSRGLSPENVNELLKLREKNNL